MSSVPVGIAVAVAGGILNGSFAIFLKYKSPWRWENFWLVYSFVALLIFPLIWIAIVIPTSPQILAHLSFGMLMAPMFFGALWGIGSILFGLGVERIGMSLTFTIVIGLATIIGTIVPLLSSGAVLSPSTLFMIIAGIAILIIGTAVSGYAGLRRERMLEAEASGARPRQYGFGLLMAIVSGIISPMNNVGFAYAKNIISLAASFGASPHWSPLVAIEAVIFGGFFVNAGYALFLLFKNKSFALFRHVQIKPVTGSIAAGLFWFGGIGLYAIATAYLGELGTSVGYAINLATGIIATNVLGIATGEWKGAGSAIKIQLLSMAVLVAGIIVIASSFFGR